MRGPSNPPAPVSGVSTPSCIGAPWPRTTAGAMPATASAPTRFTKPRRDKAILWLVIAFSFDMLSHTFIRISGTQENASYIGIASQHRGGPIAVVAPVDQNVRPVGDGQGLARILLDHRDRHSGAVHRHDIVEQ